MQYSEVSNKASEIPQELWLHILRLATSTTLSTQDLKTDFYPFEAVHLNLRDWNELRRALQTRRAIILVCRAWRAIALDFMYEEIRLRHGTRNLQDALSCSNPNSSGSFGRVDLSRFVRRVYIDSKIQDFDPLNPLDAVPILQQCRFAEIIVRPSMQPLTPPLCRPRMNDFPFMHSVKRIDWSLPLRGPGRAPRLLTGEFLGELLRHTPELRYLNISGGVVKLFNTLHVLPEGSFLYLPSLTTLRLECEDDMVLMNTQFELPNLTNLVLCCHVDVCHPILLACGSQIKVVEIMRPNNYEGHEPWDTVAPVLHHCPNLEELYLYIEDLPLDPWTRYVSESRIRTLGLYIHFVESFWLFVDCHAEIFIGTFIPFLERVVLYGEIEPIRHTERFKALKKEMECQSRMLILAE